MTLEELWELFPIVLTPHNPLWREWAEDEMRRLGDILADFSPVINHIGSTAIPDIQAKPIIDLLAEVSAAPDWEKLRRAMISAGYICMSSDSARMSFNKGYTPRGYAERVFHIHIHRPGDNDPIFFRDYLTAHPDAAKEYERLKLSLAPQFRHDRDGYTAAKTDFVSSILSLRQKSSQ